MTIPNKAGGWRIERPPERMERAGGGAPMTTREAMAVGAAVTALSTLALALVSVLVASVTVLLSA